MARYSREEWDNKTRTMRPAKKKRSKYKNVRTVIDGKHFDSLAEGRYFNELKLRILAGEVSYFLRQVPFDLPGNVKYRVDFQVFLADGSVEYIDVKGVKTPMFIMKKKQVEELYPVEIICVKVPRR